MEGFKKPFPKFWNPFCLSQKQFFLGSLNLPQSAATAQALTGAILEGVFGQALSGAESTIPLRQSCRRLIQADFLTDLNSFFDASQPRVDCSLLLHTYVFK